MAAYLRMLLNRGEGPAGRLISEESFDLITQPITTRNAALSMPARNYGYGLMTWEQDGHQFLGPFGRHGGVLFADDRRCHRRRRRLRQR